MNLKHNLHWLICILFFAGCAKVTAPTGGPKDTIPPVLIKSTPPDEAVNFRGKSMEMLFSEMVIVNNPREQLIVTPTIGKDFEMTTRKNSVILSFETELEDSTTYTFNFRESIQDITEKNPLDNFQLAFSTGPYIDSLSIEGNVLDMIKGTPLEDATVAVHPKNDTFNIMEHPATIFTKTDKKGLYKIDHLKPGIYYLYAFNDKNRNLVADSRSESYGFLEDSLNLQTDTTRLTIPLIHLDTRDLKLTSARPYNTYFNFRTTKNVKDFALYTPGGAELKYSFGEDHSNIRLYNTMTDKDSILVNVIAYDSIGNKLDSTVYAKFNQREVIPEKFNASMTSSNLIAAKGLLTATFTFSKPLKEINFDSLYFQIDSLTMFNFSASDTSWSNTDNTLRLEKTLDSKLFVTISEQEQEAGFQTTPQPDTTEKAALKKLNELHARPAAFISIENDSSIAISQKIVPKQVADLSMIIFNIQTEAPDFIVQILDKDYKVVQQLFNTQKGQFEDLPAGDYMMRVIIDKNKNGKWDPGNYFENKEPEPMIYYRDEKQSMKIPLKANWENVLAPMLITS